VRGRESFGARVGSGKESVSTNRCLVALLLLLVLPSVARPPGDGPSQGDQDTIKVDVDLVVLHATVRNRQGILVSGLKQEDFQVFEDRVPQEIKIFSHEDTPVTVGLVVDNSGSMKSKRARVVAAALVFARSSHPKDQMFVVNFNESVTFGLPDNTPFTDNEDQLRAALSGVKADGMTALYDAIAAGLEHLKRAKQDKKVLIVVSDGADNASQHTLAQIMDMAGQSDAIIYTLGTFEQDDPDRNPGVLKRLARATGGEAFLPGSVQHVVPICERIARDIRNQYTIAYIPTNRKQDGTYRAIQVQAGTPDRERLLVRTRAGYYALVKPHALPEARHQP